MSEHTLAGIPAAAGCALGPVLVYHPETGAGHRMAGSAGEETQRFRSALSQVAADLDRLAQGAEDEAARIVAAHLMMLDDPELHGLAESGIQGGQSAEQAVQAAVEQFAGMLEALDDAYLRERAADIRDVGRRLVAALTGRTVGLKLEHPCVVVARDLAPTDTIGVSREYLLGIVTEQGGPTSHTCILARSWGIPAVVGASGVLTGVQSGITVALDGSTGQIVLEPGSETMSAFEAKLAQAKTQAEADRAEAGLPAVTLDGHRIELAANAGSPDDVEAAMSRGAEAIGLLRSEFLFMGRDTAPDEETQFQAYAAALRHAGGHRVIIRTLDIGGDKHVPYLDLPREENPFLGCRALRLCFERTDLFRTQLRALLRAGVHGRLAIMFPMVGSLEDLRRAKAALTDVQQSLDAEGIPRANDYELGIMIEIPSAALIAPHLAREVDFFSIGTNDLVQYTLAVDRGNPDLSPYYQPFHPSVLQLIDYVVRAAHAEGKWVGVCGEMGGQAESALLLVGLGIDELSMAAPRLPAIRRLVRGVTRADAAALARQVLACGTEAEVRSLIKLPQA